jgi:Ca-activated chloride channel family protein
MMKGLAMKGGTNLEQNSRHRRAIFIILFLSGAIAVLSSSNLANPIAGSISQKPISVTTELVAIPVSVTDHDGNFVSGLTKSNFQIVESNPPREIVLFEQEDTPVSVGLLIDHSGSMESKLPNVVTSISGFTRSSNPQDEMFVVNFGDEARVQPMAGKDFTSDPSEITRAVAMAAEGRTALYDAVSAGLNHLRSAHWQKRALLLVSDGGDNASRYKYSQVLAQARQSQVSIYAIGLVDEWGEEENPHILEQLCKDTGGIAFFPRTASAAIEATKAIARDLREQYMLAFAPDTLKGDGSFHKIQVRVNTPQHGKLHVRARAGYSTGNSPVSSMGQVHGNSQDQPVPSGANTP